MLLIGLFFLIVGFNKIVGFEVELMDVFEIGKWFFLFYFVF